MRVASLLSSLKARLGSPSSACGAVLLCLLVVSCRAPAPAPPVQEAPKTETTASSEDNGAISTGPVKPAPRKLDLATTTQWPEMALTPGVTWISCELDYVQQGDGESLEALDFATLEAPVKACQAAGVMRIRYTGKINAEFTALMERASIMANRLGIEKRVLDIDSSGGRVEDGIRAGDIIGASHWTLWVRDGAICHSSCLLILASGDNRIIAGKVGIHRMMRINSGANSRAELAEELRQVYGQLKDYLERNGAAVTVADLMMTVPNRRLRLLTATELEEYGLQGANAAQDDLDRIQLTRKCGEEFVRRKDDFMIAFDRQCGKTETALDDINACGLALRKSFGFPDTTCPMESPLAEFDRDAAGAL
ncbi:hypothetical protein [Pseudoxanthomonas indica]|uniref:Uncharacterized protein n=1 Tax=Pseudoxanthomonas indica TaxID=428993 RepID=A0A1T5LQ18_9GAMM|nr:hypothetical protein [Pseudoxanthomonas indica]GGD37504.1 hypothetical protein GCM10007235_07110 [Pseudoxanthomonas indica]SKC77638.1 hypothetical protein SAMN06296058_2833 [Pseudoxanthomonas indica]